jgi:hypothetical protein
MEHIKKILLIILIIPLSGFGQIGIWTSAEELAEKPMQGLPWDQLLSAADAANPNGATVSDQNSNNNVEILAAAIVYARTGGESYKDKVIAACDKLVSEGKPADRTLAWARETGAYVLAADLVGYRPNELKVWLRAMAESYVAEDNRTMIYMFQLRPNNWGTMGFGSLCAIYAFLQDTTSLTQVRNYWIQSVTGPKPELLTYGSDLSWHVDPQNLRLINPKGAVKEGLNIDGIIPDDMRRGSSFSNPPVLTGYAWETLQGLVTGARILDRFGIPVWTISDSALNRAFHVIQVDWENKFGGWKAEDDDLWMLPYIDDVYGTNYSELHHERTWRHGKIAGWPYVIWDGDLDTLTVNVSGSGTVRPDGGYFLPGASVDIIATPNDEWRFSHWEGDVSATSNPLTLIMDASYMLTAVFEKIPKYKLNINIEGSGEVFTSPEDSLYLEGTEVELSVQPSLGWVFDGWSGDTTSIEETITVKMDSNISIIARFEESPEGKFELRISNAGPGSVNVSPQSENNIYDSGTIIFLEAIPDISGGKFIWWSDSLFGSKNPVEIILDRNMAITANFSGGEVIYGGSWSATASASTDTINVTTESSIPAIDDALYLSVISSLYNTSVYSVEGLGLSWSLVKNEPGGDGKNFLSVWKALGEPNDLQSISAKVQGSELQENTVILNVSFYGSVNVDQPIGNVLSANTNGVDGGDTGGSKVAGYSYTLQTLTDNAQAFGVVSHDGVKFTPQEDFTQRDSCMVSSQEDTVGITILDKNIATSSNVSFYGLFNPPVDYALIIFEINSYKIQTGIPDIYDAIIPEHISLNLNYPNPFNSSTVISYTLKKREQVKLNIFDIAGKRVASLADEIQDAGNKAYMWQARSEKGDSLPSGIYFCILKAGPRVESIKMLYLK